MDREKIKALEAELFQYVSDVGGGKHFEILGLEIRNKIDVLNKLIEEAIDEGSGDLHVLIHMAYHYYQLLYG